MKKNIIYFVTLLFLSNNAFSQTQLDKKIFKLYKTGAYAQAIELLKKSKPSSQNLYLTAISYNRLQEFDNSIKYFKRAIRAKASAKDIYYEYGQALYAASELEKARKSFLRSAKLNYKSPSSYYYIGHISQILEQYKRAKNYFQKILKDKSSEKNIVQVARFQLAETLLSLARKKSDTKRIVKKYVLPQITKALRIDEKSTTSFDIRRRKKEIEREFGLDPNLMVNGRRISKKKYRLSFSHKMDYDNNVTLSTDEPSVVATQKDSYIHTTSANASYRFIFKRRYTTKPGLLFTKVKYGDRDNSEVYTNDYWTISPSLKNGFEHKLFNKMSTLIFDISYDYKSRDRLGNKDKIFYNRAITYTLGEKIKFFNVGNTSFKVKKKFYRSYSQALDNDVFTFSFDQVYNSPGKFLLLFLYQMDSTDYFNDSTESTVSNLFRVDFIKSNILPSMSLGLNFSSTFLSYDDATKSTANGTELTLGTGISLTKKVSKNVSLVFGYDYTNANSDNESNKYSKHVTGVNLKLNF
jgi:tetratricopeptide (TPR) repeat protein